MNTAQQLHHVLGISQGSSGTASDAKHASHRKAGPGRRHATGNGTRTAKQRQAGAYGRGLRNWIKQQNMARQANKNAAKMAAM